MVVYNGEIYNFAELRRRLLARGHRFRTAGDTEVLVHLYEDRGMAMVRELDGMFAFAIYDRARHLLLLARDPVGIKPLYMWVDATQGQLMFTSDLHAMLEQPQVPRRLDPLTLRQYLQLGYAVAPRTWIEGVTQLMPGELAVWCDGGLYRERYYRWQYTPDAQLSRRSTGIAELGKCVEQAVASQLVADVPLGAFLSGGLDSSCVVGMAQRADSATGDRVASFTVEFWQSELDETARARRIAAELGVDHQTVPARTLTFGRELLDAMVTALGEPFGDTSALGVYALCEAARTCVKVALSGDGGDELFLGYAGLFRQALARRLRIVPKAARRWGAEHLGASERDLPRRLRKYLHLSLQDDFGVLLAWAARWQADRLEALLPSDTYGTAAWEPGAEMAEVRDLVGDGQEGGFVEQQIRFHLLVDLPGDCLFKIDRASMAHGLEVRVPLLSRPMLDFAARLPLSERRYGTRTKEPLRSIAESLAPTLRDGAGKRGFDFPLDDWMRRGLPNGWRQWELTDRLAGLGFRAAAVDELVSQYERVGAAPSDFRTRTLARQLWDLLLLGLWVERYSVEAP